MDPLAEEVFGHSLELAENNALTCLHLALLFEKKNETALADSLMRKALHSSLVTPSIRFQAALFFKRNGDHSAAEELSVSLKEIKPVYHRIISGEFEIEESHE
jgi:hypothetical protein